MLQLTDRAVDKVKGLMAAEGKQGYGLRVAVRGGGCSGFEYAMSYEQAQQDSDEVLHFNGLPVYLDPMSLLYLSEVKIDYLDTLQESGFKITNSKATGTCGCGSSFSV